MIDGLRHDPLTPRVLGLLGRTDGVERFVVAFGAAPIEFEGYNDADQALEALRDRRFDAVIVKVATGNPFERALVQRVQRMDPHLPVVALSDSSQAEVELCADGRLHLAAVIVEPWSPKELIRTILDEVFATDERVESRVAEGALGSPSRSAGRPSLLPLTLPALLRFAGGLLFPAPNSSQGAFRHTPSLAGPAAGPARREEESRRMATTLVREAGQGPTRLPAGGYVSA